jgi:hypothetical protein
MTTEEQIIAAIKEGFKQVAEEQGTKAEDAIKKNKEKDDGDVESLFKSSSKSSSSGESDFINSFTNFVGEGFDRAGGVALGAMKLIEHEVTATNDKIKDLTENQIGYFTEAKKALGNIGYDMETGQAKMTGITKQYVEQYEAILKSASSAVTESNLEFSEGILQGMDPMYSFFESAEAAARKFGEIMQEIGSDTPRVLQQINETEAKRITFFAETLQLAEDDIASFLKRQYAFTGEASDEILGKIGTTSKALSEATGISANQVKEGIVQIMKDVDKFGNIGVDAAGRISAALSQLGVDFQSFQALTDSFMNFDSAANKMGELSTLFGIQMDAMEMTYLANEDQEEFLFRMREEIMDAGIDVENMSNTRARALSSQLNMSVTEMKTFLREGELAIDQEQMTASTEAADQMDALTVAGRDFGNQFARAAQTAKEALEEKFIPGAVDARNELFGMASHAARTASEIQKFEIPKEINAMRKDFEAAKISVEQIKEMGASKIVNFAQEAFDDVAVAMKDVSDELLSGMIEKATTEINNLYEKYLGENAPKIDVQVNSPVISQIQDMTTANQLMQAKNQSQVSSLLTQMGLQTAQVDSLMKALQEDRKVNLHIDLDGDRIADKTFRIMSQKGQTVEVSTL